MDTRPSDDVVEQYDDVTTTVPPIITRPAIDVTHVLVRQFP
jgi:hypothetical protein